MRAAPWEPRVGWALETGKAGGDSHFLLIAGRRGGGEQGALCCDIKRMQTHWIQNIPKSASTSLSQAKQ